jgi:peptidoglycan/xylan/chitin deacetylase (PgdA/CDA1 family)
MSSLTARAAHWQNSHGCMLTFHRAALAAEWASLPNRNFYLNLDYLDRLLSSLKQDGWEVATVEDITGRLQRGEDGSRLVNFSVDDCYKDTFELVLPLFRRHRVPVTLFVTTGIPDGTMLLGWAGLETILARRGRVTFEGEIVRLDTDAAKQQWFAKISQAWDTGDFDGKYLKFCEDNGADPAKLREEHAMTWEMLEKLAGNPFVEIGAHTISHPRVSELPPVRAMQELVGARDRLRSQLSIECRHFAFPYGRSADCSERDFDLARDAGFASAATTRKGLLQPGQNLFSLPRNTLNGAHQSLGYASFLLSGLAGLAAKVLGRV